ncbi:signal peptide peptidase SppA [Candidatus Uabimicrobium sp. HlEnr_7]|uniref:signal peptide peptidase SppA n=1 Tax=Candidatus Uabimicrobium helgolandensis TaxID=3095367 RepID=UPI003555F13C
MFKKFFSGFFFSILSVVLICVLFVSIMLNVVLLGSSAMQNASTLDNEKHFSEEKLEGNNKDLKILVVSVEGMISDSGPDSYIVKSKYIEKVFEQAAKDKNIRGVILNINSPGGTITATDKMYNTIAKYKSKMNVPVIAYFDSVAASGGYYMAMACDKIISHATTITGSIGVIMSFYQAQELLENKLGIESVVIKSGEHKDIGSSSRKTTDSEREILNSILQEMYSTFLEKVRAGRSELKDMPEDELKKIADGRIYTGKQALAHKLVDELGYFSDAQDVICELSGLKRKEVSFVEYKKNSNAFLDLLKAESSVQGSLQNMIRKEFTANFYYLWRP